MKDFEQKDIKPLDFIVNRVLEINAVTVEDLIKEGLIKEQKGEGFVLDVGYSPKEEFLRYLTILKKYNACFCSTTGDSVFATSNENTHYIKKRGGFQRIYDEQLEENQRKEIEFDLTQSNIRANELNEKNTKHNKVATWINIMLGVVNIGLLMWQILKE